MVAPPKTIIVASAVSALSYTTGQDLRAFLVRKERKGHGTGGLVEGEGDVCQIALVERHRATGGVTNAFVSGFGYQGKMAMASTVAHDSHHMIVVGTDREQMALAANRLAEVGGGITLFRDGQELALVELPIAGLMSDSPAAEVAAKADRMVQAMQDCGCQLNNAYMQHSLLALVVIPELRISDLGLVDVRTFEKIDLCSR